MHHAFASRAVSVLALALVLPGCAHDVIIEPAASTFAQDAGTAMTTVSQRYDETIRDLNEQNVRFLTDNPACGLNTIVRLRTPEADALLQTLGPPVAVADAEVDAPPDRDRRRRLPEAPDACLSEAEWEQLDALLDTRRDLDPAMLAPQRQLLILSRADFDLQLAAVEQVTDYVAELADAASEPEPSAAREIAGVAEGVLAISEGAGRLGEAGAGADDGSLAPLFASGGPVGSFAGHLGELAGVLETIADEARDGRTLRQAILGPAGQQVPALLQELAKDSDAWSCIRHQARLGQIDADSQRLSPQLPRMSRSERLDVVRDYLEKRSIVPEAQCGSAALVTRISPIGQMLDALVEAHEDLERIARGELNAAERRRQAAATMQRLGAVFKAIGSAAMVVL